MGSMFETSIQHRVYGNRLLLICCSEKKSLKSVERTAFLNEEAIFKILSALDDHLLELSLGDDVSVFMASYPSCDYSPHSRNTTRHSHAFIFPRKRLPLLKISNTNNLFKNQTSF